MSCDLRVAVEVALDDLLGQLDRELGHPALQVGQRPLGREPDVLLRAAAQLRRVGLGPGDQVLAHLVRGLSRASSMICPASFARLGELALVVGERRLGLGPWPPRPARGRARILLLAVLRCAFLIAGHAFHASSAKTMKKQMTAQTISLVSGTIGFFAFTSLGARRRSSKRQHA